MAIQRIIIDVAMLDGTEHSGVVVTTADRMKLAGVARRQKWGTMQDDPDRSITFLAYAALCRLGQFSGSFDDFVNASETVTAPEVADVDPTLTNTPAV